mgnify:CR=1 FL=1
MHELQALGEEAVELNENQLATVNLPAAVGGWLNYSVAHTYPQSGGFKATLYQGGAGVAQPIVGSATIIVGAAAPTPPAGTYAYSAPSISTAGMRRVSTPLM